MSSSDLLEIEPLELKFPFELRKQISCSLLLTNKSDDHIAFKVKTTSPKKYCVRPNTGVVLPRSTCDVIITMQAQKEMPADMQCKDKFLVQSVVSDPGIAAKDITQEMFTKESGNKVDEVKLRVLYVAPPQPPSPVPEESEEGSSPRASEGETKSLSRYTTLPRARMESEDSSPEVALMISRLSEERNVAIQQNKNLRQELETLKREVGKKQGGSFSLIVVIFVALLGILLGYFFKK
ncbi:Vesicle-associated protein 1-1 [Rhynchospora pubera]|uniref:Vesicle-associated protein 1-1 n=1 Tax=Rhynchospora pubera TaxID=906938 RepID=A0AAV8ECN5_9POAL|nr:Vesicle-associated protein 1-1 [Rhynchospora pubera]KAJ4804095.1 Vesicle-associated protein 1-1 [Rhynchospora pubera]